MSMNYTPSDVSSFVSNFRSGFPGGHIWVDSCINQLRIVANTNPDAVERVLVNNVGEPASRENSTWDAWGISTEGCQQFCSRSHIQMEFDFNVFSSGITNYFLPWLFLTAQLPYETGSPFKNFMSFSLAVGSPMLITFSLFMTALNGHWIRNRFARLTQGYNDFFELQEAARFARDFLRGSQQNPIRINKEAFDQLFTNNATVLRYWWQSLNSRLETTRRPFTFSLVAQGLFAVIVWGLTITASFATGLGIPSQALLVSSGTLWVWLVPVTVGWVLVGSQYLEDGIKLALNEYTDGGSRPASQVALQARSGLPDPLEAESLPHVFWSNVQGDERLQGPVFNFARILTVPRLADSVASAFESKVVELQARANATKSPDLRMSQAPHTKFSAQCLASGGRTCSEIPNFESYEMSGPSHTQPRQVPTIVSTQDQNNSDTHHDDPSLEIHEMIRGRRSTSPGEAPIDLDIRQLSPHSRSGSYVFPHVPTVSRRKPNTTTTFTASEPKALDTNPHIVFNQSNGSNGSKTYQETDFKSYVEWKELDSSWKRNVVVSNFLALFLQWGVCGAAVVIAYNTPARGIGCRPSSYLLYAILATTAHSLLLCSVFLSHEVMLIHQGRRTAASRAPQNRRLAAISALAVLTRISGKVIATSNAFWIIISSIFEMIGFYNSCFCEGSMLIPNSKAWILLFLHSDDLRQEAQKYWALGIAMSALVCLATFWVIFLYRTRQ